MGQTQWGLTARALGSPSWTLAVSPHEDLDYRIAGFLDVIQRQPSPYDDNGHGTHVCGIIGGSGKAENGLYSGIAPGCHLIPVKVLDRRGNGYSSDVLTGLRWIRENKERWNIRIVNISVGSFSTASPSRL